MSSTKCSLSRLDHAWSLAGDWEFQLDPDGELDIGSIHPDRTIPVPLPWQAAMPDLRRYAGYAWYRRSFEVEGDLEGGDLRLGFGAVDYWCEVFLNRTRLAEHEGGYTPFEVGLRDALVDGGNEITVRVFDPVQTAVVHERWPDYDEQMRAARGGPPFVAAHVPHGKQDWYVNTGGIWQDVTLTPRAAAWIDSLHITPDLDLARAVVEVRVAGDFDRVAGSQLRLEIQVDGVTIAGSEVALEPRARSYTSSIAIPDVRPWTLDQPFMYDVVASLDVEGRTTRTMTRFGMRSFGAQDGQFVLNGKPVYLVGVLDQDFWPQTVATAPSQDHLREQYRTVKRLGFNCLRCHIKPPDPIYLDLADEIGLLVWEELPSWRTYWSKGTLDPGQIELPTEVRSRVEGTLDVLIDRDFNHPSLVIRTLVNEDWGTALPFSASDRCWIADLYDRGKRLDPTRLIVDNSACAAPWGASFHVKSDIEDFHVYATIPGQAALFADTVADLALRPLWTFSPHGDAERQGDEPIVLSEFGNWGLPTMAAIGRGTEHEPAWFDVRPWGSGWGQEPGSPAGVQGRFRDHGLGSIWADFDDFASATQAHQVAALRHQVETLRRRSSIAGYVITELTDTYWESNGLLDFERRPKAPIADIAAFNAQDMLIATPDRRSFASGGEARIDVMVSLNDGRIEEGSRIQWSLDGRERVERMVVNGGMGSTRWRGPISIRLPDVDALTYAPISISLVGPDDTVAAASVVTVAVVPDVAPAPAHGSISVLDDSGTASLRGSLADRLAAAGYPIVANLDPDADLAVSNTATADLLEWVHSGGRLLFLAERRNPFFWVQGHESTDRGWITRFSWVRPTVHRRLGNVVNPVGLEFEDVMPVRTIAGLPFDDAAIHEDVLAGTVVGWVHHPTADTVQFRFGVGRVVMTTFRLGSTVGLDPIGTAMFHDLVEHLRSDGCRPALGADVDTVAMREGM